MDQETAERIARGLERIAEAMGRLALAAEGIEQEARLASSLLRAKSRREPA
jgi:hypothetical protein